MYLHRYLEIKISVKVDKMPNELALYVVLSRAYRALLAHDERDVRRYGLNLTEFAVLELLYHKGPHPLQQIGEKILITTGTITYVVDKLQEKGLLYRKTDETDRRKTFAVLTDEGTALLRRIFPAHAEALKHAMGGLTTKEQALAAQLLKKLGLEATKRFDIINRGEKNANR